MKSESYWPFAVVVIAVIAIAFLFQQPSQIVVNADNEEVQLHRLTVSGEAELETPADEAELWLRIEARDDDPKVAQDKASEIGEGVLAALRKAGVAKGDIETRDYNLYRRTEWSPKTEKVEELGFEASHTLVVKTKSLNTIGVLLKAAVDAGVNNVQNIQFTLSKEKQREIKSAVLAAAAKQAEEKAQALASSLGVSLGQVVTVSESSYYVMPYAARALSKDMLEAAPAPPIQPGEVSSQAQVSVVYSIS